MATPSEAEVSLSREVTSFNENTLSNYGPVGKLLTAEIKRTRLKGDVADRKTLVLMHRLAFLADELNAHEVAISWMGEIQVECGSSAAVDGWLIQEQNTQRINMTRVAEEAMSKQQQQQTQGQQQR
jgi:hypothetical protein